MLKYFCREPYRVFFPLGILFGLTGVLHWSFYALEWSKTYSGFFHSSIQILAYMNCFVFGFLLTAMPRFAAIPHATPQEFFIFLSLMLGIFIFIVLGYWVAGELCFLGLLVFFIYFIGRRFAKREKSDNLKTLPPVQLIWLPIAILHGITATVLLILSQLKIIPVWFASVGKPMIEQGFLLSIVSGIGGFLVPRLLGISQATNASGTPMARKLLKENVLAGAILFLSFFIEAAGMVVLAYGLRAIIATYFFISNGVLLRLPRQKDFFVQLIWLSIWMIVIGLWMVVIFPDYRVTMLHIVFIGGFSLMTFAVATMVILSHANEGEALRRPLWVLWIVGVGLLAALLKRLTIIFYPDSYFRFLNTAAFVWGLAALSWLCFIFPRIFKVPTDDAFERMHQEAKERLLKNRQ